MTYSHRLILLASVFCTALLTGQAWAEETPLQIQAEVVWNDKQPSPVLSGKDRLVVAHHTLPETQQFASAMAVDFSVALVSDYRTGGLSSSNGKPALQAQIGVEHQSGIYASLWGSTIAENIGSDIELNAAAGFAFPIALFTADIGAIGYIFPGLPNSNYVELQAGLSRSFGNLELTSAIGYTPSQKNTGNRDNIYAGFGFELPLKNLPLTLAGNIGIEDGAFGDRKVDWQLGGTYQFKGIDLGLAYIDAARTSGEPYSGGTIIASISKGF